VRAKGQATIYAVEVTALGPGPCRSQAQVRVAVPAGEVCPTLLRIDHQAVKPTAQGAEVVFRADLQHGQAEQYHWDWGDGRSETTSSATARHTFAATEAGRAFTVRLRTEGPGDCRAAGEATIELPQQEPEPRPELPWLCRWLPYIVAFLGALTLGLGLIWYAGNALGQAEPGQEPVVAGLLLGSALLLIGAVIYWLSFAPCDPQRCDALAVGWATALGGLVISAFLWSCFNALPLSLLCFLVMAVLGYFWFRGCAPQERAKVFIGFLAAALLAMVIDGLLVAEALLTCT